MIEAVAPLLEGYATALRRYVGAPDEEGRAEAYALGRAAMAEGWGVLDLAQAHASAVGLPACAEEARLAAEFFGEALGPYEMALRGFRDANAGLRNLNRTLEQRISERTAALERSDRSLRQKTQVLQGILDSMSDGVAVAGPDGRFVLFNGAGKQLLGSTSTRIFWSDEATPVPSEESPLLRAMAGAESRDVELFVRSDELPAGQHVSISASALAGRERGAVMVLRNISARRQAESEARLAEERLRQSQKMDAIGQLAGGVAHDFNNLLAVIVSYAELAELELPADHAARGDLAQITRAAESAAGLTRQLLAFSRRQVLQATVLDLNAAILDVERMLQRTIGEHIHLETQLDPDLGKVLADRGQIEQIVMNLAVNARDAMAGGGRLLVETSNLVLSEPAALGTTDAAAGAYSVLAVTDTGTGMDAATRARIFEPFFTTKDIGRGTGLGLATVYGIVRQSHGHIWVHSEPGRGTTFKIYFPHAAPSAPAEAALRPERAGTGDETILLVEDADALREVAVRVLTGCGYHVLSARDPAHAEAVAAAFPAAIHLLLTDVVMPGSSGTELAASLAARRPEMRVLFTSGYASAEASHAGALALHVDFLEKPFSPEQLRKRVRAALDAPPLRG